MNTTATSARICACCKRELSSENFYYNHRTQIFDKYCKECRKKRSRQYRKECRHTEKKQETAYYYRNRRFPSTHGTYSTCIGKIRASVLRKRKKIQESEYRDFGNNDVSV